MTAAIVVAGAAFLLPQEAPLVYYPLNHPSDVYYLEITCQASATGETRIAIDTGQGFNELQTIRIPIAPSARPYTYTFPLWDAPLKGLMLEPLTHPGTLTVTNMRITTRRGREIKRFTGDDFDATHEIARIAPTTNGWEFVTTPDAHHPDSLCGFFPPIIPVGMNTRNLQRCLLSWSYLSGMLWILLLAVLFVAQWRPAPSNGDRRTEAGGGNGEQPAVAPAELRPGSSGGSAAGEGANHVAMSASLPPPASGLHPAQPLWRNLARDALFMALIALLFSAVGNRGLIKHSIRYARFPVEAVKPGLRLELDLAVDPPQTAQLFWDTGHGYNETESQRRNYVPNTLYQILRFDLPDLAKMTESLRALRFDPFDAAGSLHIFGIRIVDQGRRTRLRLPPDCLRAGRDIAHMEATDSQLVVSTLPKASDPILEFKPEAVQAISRLMATGQHGAPGS